MELKQTGPASAPSGAVARYDSRVTITQVSVRICEPVHARIQDTGMECRASAFLIVSSLPSLAVGNAADSPGRTPIPEPARRTFATEFRRLCAEDKVVGASVLVVDGDRDAVFETFGFQDLDSRTPVSRDTTFHWASITKTLTSIGILQLRDRGLLRLQDPITRYAPELRKVHNPFGSMETITLQHLLTHTAGFQNGTWPWKKGEPWEPFEPNALGAARRPRPLHVHRLASRGKIRLLQPRLHLFARVIEEISGDPFVSDIDKNLLRPLDMTVPISTGRLITSSRDEPQLSPEQGRQGPRASLQFPHRDHDRQWRPQRVSAGHGHLPTFPPRDAPAERHEIRSDAYRSPRSRRLSTN